MPPGLRLWARKVAYFPVDLWGSITGKRLPLEPPKGLIYTGSGDFIEQGKRFLDYFIRYGKLRPEENVLDVGSGIGRMAVPLTGYLAAEARYEGFDVVETGVNWCITNISSEFPNFHFQFIPLENDLYTSGGMKASEFRFPYPDALFEFVFLTSVFTHMMPSEVEHYLKEIFRVLKPGGRCFATFFILTPESESAMDKNRKFWFPYKKGNYSLMEQKVVSANVAYQWDSLCNEWFTPSGFEVKEVLWGKWSGRAETECVDFQDIVVLKKNKITPPLVHSKMPVLWFWYYQPQN